MSDNVRKAIAYLNLVLVEQESKLWPDQKAMIENALSALSRLR